MKDDQNENVAKMLEKLSDQEKEDIVWLRSLPSTAIVILHGYIAAMASEHKDWTYWQLLREARANYSEAPKVKLT